MHVGGCHLISLDQTGRRIGVDVVLIPVVLFLDRGVLVPTVTLARHLDEGRVDHLPGFRHKPSQGQLVLEALEQDFG